MARRLDEVLMSGALAGAQGAATTLGVPADWMLEQRQQLQQLALDAGFPVHRLVPHPLAALAHHKQQTALVTPRRSEQVMVIDWGGSGLRLSFIEHGSDMEKPQLFEHTEFALGGSWFEAGLHQWLRDQLSGTLTETDERDLLLFARSFKEGLSRSFAEGRTSHAQYCVLPAGAPPTRVQLSREAFETQTAEARQTFQSALVEAVERIGLKPAHLGPRDRDRRWWALVFRTGGCPGRLGTRAVNWTISGRGRRPRLGGVRPHLLVHGDRCLN